MKRKTGLRSKLEQKAYSILVAQNLQSKFKYESSVLDYVVPAKKRRYTPDFSTTDGKFHIEVKGKLDFETREKMNLVKHTHPDKIIVLVFGRANNKLYRGSPTTYGDWAQVNGFLWCDIKDFETKLTEWRRIYDKAESVPKQPRRKRVQKQVRTRAE